MSAHLSTMISDYGLLAVFVLMTLESACVPIASEAVVPYAGFLTATHVMSFWSVVLVSTAANMIGGVIAYVAGRYGGRAFIARYGRYILLHERHLQRADRWFAKRGEVTVLVARLLPAVRTFISLPAGIARMPLTKFLIYSFLGSLPWNFALAFAGYQLGTHWEQIGHYMKPLTYLGAVLLVGSALWFWFGRKQQESRNRLSS